jgi:hypothetical protein
MLHRLCDISALGIRPSRACGEAFRLPLLLVRPLASRAGRGALPLALFLLFDPVAFIDKGSTTFHSSRGKFLTLQSAHLAAPFLLIAFEGPFLCLEPGKTLLPPDLLCSDTLRLLAAHGAPFSCRLAETYTPCVACHGADVRSLGFAAFLGRVQATDPGAWQVRVRASTGACRRASTDTQE